MQNQLQIIVNESGLGKTKADVILNKFQDYFAMASEWEIKAKTIKVINESQEADMQMARTGRLFLRKKRIAIENTRKELKAEIVREGKAIDGISNVLKALIIPLEEYLEKQEKFIEFKKAAEEEAKRLEIERRMEEERIENERLDKLAEEREKIALPYQQFWDRNYDFRNKSEDDFSSLMAELKNKKLNYDKEQEKRRLENERLKKEAEERERKIAEERGKKEKEMRKQQEEAERKQREIEEKAREERERLKKEAEAKQKIEREKQEKILAEQRAKAEAEKKRLEKKIAAEKKEAQRKQKELEEKLNMIKCPYCHKKFKLEEK